MKPAIVKDELVICPCCKSYSYVVYRRFMTRTEWIENHARCDSCGEDFLFFEDKYGKPVKERATIAAVLL